MIPVVIGELGTVTPKLGDWLQQTPGKTSKTSGTVYFQFHVFLLAVMSLSCRRLGSVGSSIVLWVLWVFLPLSVELSSSTEERLCSVFRLGVS